LEERKSNPEVRVYTKRVSTALISLGIMSYLAAQPLPSVSEAENRWPVARALYEVNLDYFPNHSFHELAEMAPRMADLGINVIYLLPIWETAGSQYLIRDYYKIDPSHGSPDDLRNLVKAAHKHGIRVLLDLVTSLTFDGSYILTHHPDWILKDDAGDKQRYYPFPDWGWSLDCTNPDLIRYFTEVVHYYFQEFSIDGWRIDSPMNNYDPKKVSTDHSRLPLLRALKAALKKKNPDTLFACEITSPTLLWGDDDTNDAPLFDEVCETSYHYEFCGFMGGNKTEGFRYATMEGSPAHGKMRLTLLDKIVHGQATSKEFVQYVNQYPILHNQTRAIFIENHDTERVSWAFPKQHRTLFTLIATMPGVPVIHAGQEIGSTQPSGHSGDRKTSSAVVRWGEGDREIEAFYRQGLRVRREHPALLYGKLDDVWKSGDRTIAYLRRHENDVVLVVLSFQDRSTRTVVAIPTDELRPGAHRDYRLRDLLGETTSSHKGGDLTIELPPYGFRVLSLE
jgi:cyclomaltodextrinase